MNTRPIVASLLRKYGSEKWILNSKEIDGLHNSMGIKYKKFHAPGVERGLSQSENKFVFALKSGVFFDKKGFLLIGDSMDELYVKYDVKSSLNKVFLKSEGHLLFYQQGDAVKKMTLSIREMSFLFNYIDLCEDWIRPWDWEELPDLAIEWKA